MDRKLLIWLIIPLSIIAIVLILLSFFCSDNFANIELNLGTELIAIVIVVAYVDWVIRRRDEEKWDKSLKIILTKVNIFNNGFITNIRDFLDLDIDIFGEEEFRSGDPERMLKETLNVAKKTILPMIEEDYLLIDPLKWKKLHKDLKKSNRNIKELILLFGNKIDPVVYSELLSVQTNIETFIKFYFPEFIEHPIPDPIINELKKKLVDELELALKTAIELNENLIKKERILFLD